MDAVSATTASTSTSSTGSVTSTTTDAAKTTDAKSKKSFSALFAEAKDDLKKGETLTKVDGHQFARIKGGTRDDMCINLSGNVRSGQAFDLISRGGHEFHVYGTGKDRTVVEVGKQAAAKTTDAGTTTGATTTTDTTSGGTSSTGTTKSP
jgi:hypothetical protein